LPLNLNLLQLYTRLYNPLRNMNFRRDKTRKPGKPPLLPDTVQRAVDLASGRPFAAAQQIADLC
jgi:hypothetical protein